MKKGLKVLGWFVGCLAVFWLVMSILHSILYSRDLISSLWGNWWREIKYNITFKMNFVDYPSYPDEIRDRYIITTIDKIYLVAYYSVPVIILLYTLVKHRKQIAEKFRKYKGNTKSARITSLEKEIEELKKNKS